MDSKIFFNDLTVIDFSMITTDGRILGGSATLNLSVSGPVDSHEGVVIDFSAGKKQIKKLIDGVGGFDHKCWVNTQDPNIVIELRDADATVTHRTSGLTITGELDCFTFVTDDPTADIADFLNHRIKPYSVSNVSLNANVIPVPQTNTDSHVFRYVHGLKYSSSHGCKNIVHGHKSYISATAIEGREATANMILKAIAAELDGVIFAHGEDVRSTTRGIYTVGYETEERGPMEMTFVQKFIVLETQTTVEHLVEYVRARYYDQLIASGVKELFVSEGLCKGASVLM